MFQKMIGCQIPAFGMWNYCNDLSITQYFDSAMQARLMKRCWTRRGSDVAAGMVGEKGVAGGDNKLVLFRTPSFQRKPAQQIKVRMHAHDSKLRLSCSGPGLIGVRQFDRRRIG